MNNLPCWYNINLNTANAFSSTWQWPSIDLSSKFIHRYTPSDIFDDNWLEYMNSYGLTVGGAMVFYRPAFFQNVDAHVDLTNKNNISKFAIYALNWTIGGRGSEMVWYNLPAKEEQEIKWTPANTPFLNWPVSSLTEINRHEITDQLTLVRVDIPHAIFVKSEPRWCISIRLVHDLESWEDSVEYFDNKKLLK